MPGRGRFLTFVLLLLMTSAAWGQSPVPTGARSSDGIWLSASDRGLPDGQRRNDFAGPYAVVQLNTAALDSLLSQLLAPTGTARTTPPTVVMTLPLPDGRFSRFRIEEVAMLAPELAAAFPTIRTYRGSGLDDPTATARIDRTLAGFHAQIIAAGGTVYLDPYTAGDTVNHVVYDKASLLRRSPRDADIVDDAAASLAPRTYNQFPITNGTVLRTYRLALAATAEYTAAAGGTKPLALSRMTTTMNRVNGIYERDLAVRMTVATGTGADPTALIFTDPVTDGYTNNSGGTMLAENQAKVDSVIGAGNYDIGHVFSTGGGGIAGLGVVCVASNKARGVTGLPNPVGDAFDVDYVAHEVGHQFGGNHTFNSTAGACSGNRSAAHAYEVGSGSTVMAYAGICSPEDTQSNSTDIFTFESLNEMTAFITTGAGSSCGVATATGNSLPVVTTAGTSFTVPKSTPFELTGAATDANGDALTYLWEEYDRNNLSTANAVGVDDGISPLFRTYAPLTSPKRTFPSLTYILNNANVPPINYTCSVPNCKVGETLPTTSRTMVFQLTVRDNRSGGGAIATGQTSVVVNSSTGPFVVTAPNSALGLPALGPMTVTWSVNGTNTIAAEVAILLSVDGGSTYPYTLLSRTANDGAEVVTLPNVQVSTARVRVQAFGGIFFDVSDANFAITAPATTSNTPGDFDGDGRSDIGVFRPSTNTWYIRNGSTGSMSTYVWGGGSDIPVPGDYDGDGRVDPAVFRPSEGAWYVLDSLGTYVVWGGGSDVPVPADYDGDRRTDVAVFRPSDGTWYIRNSSGAPMSTYVWGGSGDIPVIGDYDGDRRIDVAIFRPSTGTWYVRNSAGGPMSTYVWGGGSDVPVPGDYDGDGRTDVAVFRPSTGTWYIRNSSGIAMSTFVWGGLGDVPLTGDYDGDGRTDVAVFRPSTGTWYIRASSGAPLPSIVWGGTGDIPVLKRP